MVRKSFHSICVLCVFFGAWSNAIAQRGSGSVIATFPQDSYPPEAIVQADDGNLYASGLGYVYRLSSQGVELVPSGSLGTVSEGFSGNQPLLYGAYTGAALEDGACTVPDCGTLYRISASGHYSTFYTFCTDGNPCFDGSHPYGAVIPDTKGNYYGTTMQGPYEVSASGKSLSLPRCYVDGQTPCPYGNYFSPPLLGPDEALYFSVGGYDEDLMQDVEQINEVNSDHTASTVLLAPVHLVKGVPLVMASDGNAYGALDYDGVNTTSGVIFKGSDEDFYVFPTDVSAQALTVGGDGNIYGIEYDGSGYALFQLTPAGEFSTIGYLPFVPNVSSLMQASDGNFYATAQVIQEGSELVGAVVRVIPLNPVPPPIQLSFSAAQLALGKSVELGWRVNNGFSGSLQQCYGTVPYGNAAGAGSWVGPHSGSVVDGAYQNHLKITPTAPGNYTYALTCGGVESGSASLQVGFETATTLAVSSATVTQPGAATFTATVTSPDGKVAAGTVSFQSEGETLGTTAVNASGVATLTASSAGVPPGTYPVTATYSGSGTYLGSASAPVRVTVK